LKAIKITKTKINPIKSPIKIIKTKMNSDNKQAIKDTVLSFKLSTVITTVAVVFAISSTAINILNNIDNRIEVIEISHSDMTKHFDECEAEIEKLKLADQSHELEFTKVISEINSDIKAIKIGVKSIESKIEDTH